MTENSQASPESVPGISAGVSEEQKSSAFRGGPRRVNDENHGPASTPLEETLEALAKEGFTIAPVGRTLTLRYGNGDTMLCAPSAVELVHLWAGVRAYDRELAVDPSRSTPENPTGTNTDVK